MRIVLHKEATSHNLPIVRADIAFCGPSLDERGQHATKMVRSSAGGTHIVQYDSDSLQVAIDGQNEGTELSDRFREFGGAKVVLEATTLGFVELFLCVRALMDRGVVGVQVVYCEPGSYRQPGRSELLRKRHFELSGVVKGFAAVPGATLMFDERRPQHVVFFVGYEDHRLGQALEQFPIDTRLTTVVFGVPAFQAGWEMDAFANNVNQLRQLDRQPEVEFCGAENPLAAYRLLGEVWTRCQSQSRRMFVAPLGTKPHGVGAALFAAENPGVGVLYDHPIRRAQRTEATYNWHLFDVVF